MSSRQTTREVFSVSQLNRSAKRLLENQFPMVWIEGEISNFSAPSSGHWYFTLKDNAAQIRCAMFRNRNSLLKFRPEPGQQLLLRARLSLYEARGDYQLIAEHMEPAGAGALARAFEALKNKLQAEGLFEQQYKKPLPTIPRHIAVITSPTGAAIRDILTVLGRRFPAIPVTILPTAVQGQAAAEEIATAINRANQLLESGDYPFDVIIVGRGGGSMEDLWAFNEEIVARAIFNSHLPVVSAVGHEVDFCIADFTADARAATPSAAAEMLSPDGREWRQNFLAYEQHFQRQLNTLLSQLQQQLNGLKARLRHPGSRLEDANQRLDELELRMNKAWNNQWQQQKNNQQHLSTRLQQANPGSAINTLAVRTTSLCKQLELAFKHRFEQRKQQLNQAIQLLDTVSPLATLARGYSISQSPQGQVLRQSSDIQTGEVMLTRLGKGYLKSTINEIIEED